MIVGTLVLGGDQRAHSLPLPTSVFNRSGNLNATNCGFWHSNTDMPLSSLHIPSRDKRIELFTHHSSLRSDLETLDSDSGPNYRTKLLRLMDDLPEDAQAVIINRNTSTHSSLAFLSKPEMYLYGLYDTQGHQAHLLWTSDPAVLSGILSVSVDRYLLYRFGSVANNCVFLQIETVCAKWWRWMKNGSALQAFNALERRLLGTTGVA